MKFHQHGSECVWVLIKFFFNFKLLKQEFEDNTRIDTHTHARTHRNTPKRIHSLFGNSILIDNDKSENDNYSIHVHKLFRFFFVVGWYGVTYFSIRKGFTTICWMAQPVLTKVIFWLIEHRWRKTLLTAQKHSLDRQQKNERKNQTKKFVA